MLKRVKPAQCDIKNKIIYSDAYSVLYKDF